MARQPLPPQVICKILGMDEEDVKAAFESGKPPTASKDQLVDAVCLRVSERACSRMLARRAVSGLRRENTTIMHCVDFVCSNVHGYGVVGGEGLRFGLRLGF